MSEAQLLMQAITARLQKQPATAHSSLCWVVDDNAMTTTVSCLQQLGQMPHICLSNRCDIASALPPHCKAVVNDFDFSFIEDASLPLLVYRISKERSLANHILLAASQKLQTHGSLLLMGRKKEGIKTYFDLCKKTLGLRGNLSKHGDMYICELDKPEGLHLAPEIKNKLSAYRQSQLIHIDDLGFYSKPGIYGWNKRDSGSALLIEQLQHMETPRAVEHLLDLGCGYGYLAVRAAKQLRAKALTATDNNITALTYCQRNLAQHFSNAHYRGILDDCGQSLESAHYDFIVCNPPFHQGFANNFALTEKFLRAAHRLLAPKGCALFVFNAFVPAEKTAAGLFKQVQQLANNQQFKVYQFRK